MKLPEAVTVLPLIMLLFVLFLLPLPPAHAQANPFFSSGGAAAPAAESSGAPSGQPSLRERPETADGTAGGAVRPDAAAVGMERTPRIAALVSWQRELVGTISGYFRSIREQGSLSAWLPVLLFSFLYGIIHAVGPGHRKAVVFSYFLSEEARPSQGILVGNLMALLHAGTAIVVVFSLAFVLRMSITAAFEQVNLAMQIASAGLLLLVGGWMLISKGRETFHLVRHGYHGDHGDDAESAASGGHPRRKRLIPFVLAAGLIPCPGASMILIFALSLGLWQAGIAAVLAMSAGIGVTISAIAVATILVRGRILDWLERRMLLREWLHVGTELAGALMIVLLGLFLMLPLIA